jgi:hypothetical protein
MATASKIASASFDRPDEQAEKGGVTIDIVRLGGMKAKRTTYPAGWRFSKDMGADRCQDVHVGYVIDGSMHVAADDGGELDMKSGDVFMIPAGHDGWTDEGCTLMQFDEFDTAAQRFGL